MMFHYVSSKPTYQTDLKGTIVIKHKQHGSKTIQQ
jgi:hypothetical protein